MAINKPFKLVDVSRPGKSSRYASLTEAKAGLVRMGVRYPTHDFRILHVVETETLCYTTEKGVELNGN